MQEISSTLGERLRQVRKRHGLSQADMANFLTLARRSYGLYELDKTSPNADKLTKIVDHFGVSADWLLQGVDEEKPQQRSMMHSEISLKVLGLAECGMAGWFDQTGPMALRVQRPTDINDPHAFAVIAAGTSLLPEGIKPGFVCICSPEVQPESGDLIYIRDKAGKAALKIFRSMQGEWLQIEGYLAPDIYGRQQIYTEKKVMSHIEMLATVLYIKRRM